MREHPVVPPDQLSLQDRDVESAVVAHSDRQRQRERRIVFLALCSISALSLPRLIRPAPRLVWNASASMPLGLYAVAPGAFATRGDTVLLTLPAPARELAAARDYQPANVPLIKTVAAIAGDQVCAPAAVLSINGKPVASRRRADTRGRPLPWWRGCRMLLAGEVFVLSTVSPNSFDGRYFGPVPRESVIGTARLLWAR